MVLEDSRCSTGQQTVASGLEGFRALQQRPNMSLCRVSKLCKVCEWLQQRSTNILLSKPILARLFSFLALPLQQALLRLQNFQHTARSTLGTLTQKPSYYAEPTGQQQQKKDKRICSSSFGSIAHTLEACGSLKAGDHMGLDGKYTLAIPAPDHASLEPTSTPCCCFC